MDADYSFLEVELDNDVFNIRIDRPEVLNALNRGTFEEIGEAIRKAGELDEVRVVVITGKGDTFSAGGDVNMMKERIQEDGREDIDHWKETLHSENENHVDEILKLSKPIVTRVNGDAVGAGATLATIGDIVIASEEARIGDPHVGVGFVVPDNVAFWPLFTDLHSAKELLMTGDLVSADKAAELGLVNHSVPDDELDAKVEEIVDKLASNPQPALRYTKQLLNKWMRRESDELRPEAAALETVSSQLPDHEEYVDAFLNDRDPEYPSARDS